MSKDRGSQLLQKRAEVVSAVSAVSNLSEAIGNAPNQKAESFAAKAAQNLGLEVDVDKELQNLALPKPVLQLIEDPLKIEGFTIRDDDLNLDPKNRRRVTRLEGTESGKHYLLHIKNTILNKAQYYKDVVTIGFSLPPDSRVCLFSQDGDGINVLYMAAFDGMWPRLSVKAVYLPWQQLLYISKDVDTDLRGQFLLRRMGMEHLIGLASANGDQQKPLNLKEFLKQTFEIGTLDQFLNEGGKFLKRIAENADQKSGKDKYFGEVVSRLEYDGELNKQVFNEFFDALEQKRSGFEKEIRRLRNHYVNVEQPGS